MSDKKERNLAESDLFFQRQKREEKQNRETHTRTRTTLKPVQLSHVHHPQTCFFSIGRGLAVGAGEH